MTEALSRWGVAPRHVLLSVGRWSHEKRVPLLLRALPDTCLLVVIGSGLAYADVLQAELDAAAASGIRVLYRRSNHSGEELCTAYDAADCLLSASNIETHGNTIVEAQVRGCVPIVQPAGGHLYTIQHRVTGMFVDFDEPDCRAHVAKMIELDLDLSSYRAVLASRDFGTHARALVHSAVVAHRDVSARSRARTCGFCLVVLVIWMVAFFSVCQW